MITRLEFVDDEKTYVITKDSCFKCRHPSKKEGVDCNRKSICEKIMGFTYTSNFIENKIFYKAIPDYFKKQIKIKTVEVEQIDHSSYRIFEDYSNKIFHGTIDGVGALDFSLGTSIDNCISNIRLKLEKEIKIFEEERKFYQSFLDKDNYDLIIVTKNKIE